MLYDELDSRLLGEQVFVVRKEEHEEKRLAVRGGGKRIGRNGLRKRTVLLSLTVLWSLESTRRVAEARLSQYRRG